MFSDVQNFNWISESGERGIVPNFCRGKSLGMKFVNRKGRKCKKRETNDNQNSQLLTAEGRTILQGFPHGFLCFVLFRSFFFFFFFFFLPSGGGRNREP
jgi:hypothetical protein